MTKLPRKGFNWKLSSRKPPHKAENIGRAQKNYLKSSKARPITLPRPPWVEETTDER